MSDNKLQTRNLKWFAIRIALILIIKTIKMTIDDDNDDCLIFCLIVSFWFFLSCCSSVVYKNSTSVTYDQIDSNVSESSHITIDEKSLFFSNKITMIKVVPYYVF